MTDLQDSAAPTDQQSWLQRYYFARAAVSAVWVALAFGVGPHSAVVAAVLLVIYPAWDAGANYIDAAQSGGLSRNRTQLVNLVVSAVTTLAVGVVVTMSAEWTLRIFGGWAVLAGAMQLATAARRWKTAGGQWTMILSGGQSVIVGFLFMTKGSMALAETVTTVAGYAALGAVYFFISAVWLVVKRRRAHS